MDNAYLVIDAVQYAFKGGRSIIFLLLRKEQQLALVYNGTSDAPLAMQDFKAIHPKC